jgi:RNA polymerase sigma-70 factor (sigma-E family)
MDGGFEAWAQASTPSLLRVAFLLCGQQHAAEDLVQGALEKVSTAWHGIDGHPDAYARVVLYRLNVSKWRRRKLVEVSTHTVPDRGEADHSDRVERRLILAAALMRLTRAQRSVLVLRFYEDLSAVEVAEILRCSVGTVKSQTHKALRALRDGTPELAELVGRRMATDV